MATTRTAFITGATAGFGHAMALRFAGAGWRVIATGRRSDRLESLRKELGDACHIITLDVRDRGGVMKAVENVPPPFDRIDVLVNNAGLALGLEMAPEADLENWDVMVDTNIKGLMYATRAVLPGMVSRNHGHIVNVGSIAATTPYPGGNVYGATKAFVHQFSRNLRAELLGTAVRVTNVEPGLAETEFSIVRFKGDTERAKSVYKGVDALTGEDLAEVVFWVVTLPAHVNVNLMEIMPVSQAWGPPAIHRKA
jgi:3-hydroxy acid dehydrogenase / malonic semialdehyde reductase